MIQERKKKLALMLCIIVAMLALLFGTQQVNAACTMTYPEICWENLDLSGFANRPRLIRHSMAWFGTTGLIIYGGLDPATNDLNNNVYFIQIGLPPSSGAAWTVVGVTTLCQSDQTCATQHLGLKARMDHSMVYRQEADNTHTIVIYGGISNVRLRDCWKYSLTSSPSAGQGPNIGTWRQQNDLSGGGVAVGYRYGHTATMIQHPTDIASRNVFGRMMIFGGTSQINAMRNDLDEFWSEPSRAGIDGTWTTPSPITVPGVAPTAVSQHCAASVHDFCIYVYGGLTQLAPLTSTNQLVELCRADPANATWTNPRPLGWTTYTTLVTSTIIPSGPMFRYSHQCTKAGNRLLAHGGRPNIAQPNYGSDMIDFDPVLLSWGNVAKDVMFANDPGTGPAARSEHASGFFTFNNEYYQFYHGGQTSSTNYDDLFVHNYRRPECVGGFYAGDGTMNCLPCPAGSISPNASYTCTNCTIGQYTNGEGQNTCIDCPLGTFLLNASGGNLTDCINCPIGHYSDVPGRNYTCDVCPYGTYSTNITGRPFCYQCPGGTFNNYTQSVYQTDCRNCSERYFAKPGSRNCTICPGGTYAPNVRTENCSICAAGTWSDQGEIECHNCSIGTSNEVPGSAGVASCVQCRPGTYAPAEATPQCILCPDGHYSNSTGATSISTCIACPLGRFNPNPGAPSLANCSFCPQGTYQNTLASNSCILCPPGTYNEAIGSVGIGDCQACPAGTYGPSSGLGTLADCLPCPAGHYQPKTGQFSCLKCPNGTAHNTTGVGSRAGCTPCSPDHYSEEGAAVCSACPTGSGNKTRTHFTFVGWERCQSCDTEENSHGWVKNGHFEHDKVHAYWVDSVSTGGCTSNITGGGLVMTSISNGGECQFKQDIPLSSVSTFPYQVAAKAAAAITADGPGAYVAADFNMTLKNGSFYIHTLNFGQQHGYSTWTQKQMTLDYTPLQVESKDLLAHLHIITNVQITLHMKSVTGTVTWDDIMFSPFSSQMCNCSNVLREAEFYNIDLFNRKVCDRCVIGKFCNGAGHFPCPADTYSYGGFPSCRKCTKGLQCVDGIASTCELTQFKNETANRCQNCPLDSGCRNTDRHICQPGEYGQGHRHCYPCPAGTFCNSVGCTSCQTCSDGYTSNFLRTGCFPCPLGHYSTGGAACKSCDWGTFANTTATVTCSTCPGGKNTTCLASKEIGNCLP